LLKFEAVEADLVVVLVGQGLLSHLRADDPGAINAAAAKLFQQVIDGETSHDAAAIRDKVRIGLLLRALRRKSSRGSARRTNDR
jgi:hypothetical protein